MPIHETLVKLKAERDGYRADAANMRVQLDAALASERELQMDFDSAARERDEAVAELGYKDVVLNRIRRERTKAEMREDALRAALQGLVANIEEYRASRPHQGDSALAELLWGEAMVNAREALAAQEEA